MGERNQILATECKWLACFIYRSVGVAGGRGENQNAAPRESGSPAQSTFGWGKDSVIGVDLDILMARFNFSRQQQISPSLNLKRTSLETVGKLHGGPEAVMKGKKRSGGAFSSEPLLSPWFCSGEIHFNLSDSCNAKPPS